VSPTKVFASDGSQSYASVEQAHIAHDQDTDAQWHERFVQSANKALLTPKEREQGLRVMIDNRAALRGTAVDRMTYYTAGIAAGIITRNEAREMEGYDRHDDPAADALTPAANLFGNHPTPTADESAPSDPAE
jgi:phage portal protein BeeE